MRLHAWMVCLAILGCHLGCHSIGPRDLIALHDLAKGISTVVTSKPRGDASLQQARVLLDEGKPEEACELIKSYVLAHPEVKTARAFHAEVLFTLARYTDARIEFERAIAGLQQERSLDLDHVLHCHGRLLEIADGEADAYHVHLHRGISLYWLAHRQDDDEPDGLTRESVLFKAAGELNAAHEERPDEARAMWYLHLTWKDLGQSPPARRWLTQAQAVAPFSELTPWERDAMFRP